MTATRPDLSIVITTLDPAPVLMECLAAIEPQLGPGVEVVLVDGSAKGAGDQIHARFPWARVIESKARSLPKLRGAGMAAATGGVVGILDSWCLVNSQWVADALRVHGERPELVIGGGVDLDGSQRRRLTAWATYLFDYWEFVPPFPAGPVAVLPGNNITYKRAALPDADSLRAVGFWKAFTNARLKEAGHTLWSSAGMSVRLRRTLPLGRFFRSRYHHGRSYAAMRVQSAPWRTRIKWSLITPGLPLLFLARQLRALRSRPGYRRWLLATAPLLIAFHASWAWGELCGYISGPGHSHDAIRS